MVRYPFAIILALALGAVLLTGADRPPGPTPPPAPPAVGAGNAEAAAFLDRAIAACSAPQVTWMEMTLWQQIWDGPTAREIHGRYAGAPDHRLRIELKVKVDRVEGQMLVICDGNTVWEHQQFGKDWREPTWTELPTLGEDYQTPEMLAAGRSWRLGVSTFLGPGPLLSKLRKDSQGLGQRAARWNGVDVVQVTGNWAENRELLKDLSESQKPRHPARLWTVYLDGRTLWPHRLEWWGAAPQGEPVLLHELEFREPVLNRPMPPERCALEFKVPEKPKQ
jgi:hypothetical protein